MPTRRRSDSTSRMPNTDSPLTRTSPVTCASLTKSIVRLMQRSSVVLPELAGPTMAVMLFLGTEKDTPDSAEWLP
jgi:ribosomal protein S19